MELKVKEIRLDSYGVVDDRRFMLIDGNNRFLSQRKYPKLATVHSKFITNEKGERELHVCAPGMETELKFPPILTGERTEVGVWEDKVKVIDQGDEPSCWFSKFIGHGGTFTRLVASAESGTSACVSSVELFDRTVSNLPPGLKGRLPDQRLALADVGPVTLVSTESLDDVNRRMKERECGEVPLSRFRMNIEVSGCCKPFEEDDWFLLRIGTTPFLSYTNAERCKVTGIDQDSGEQDKLGPLEILRMYRAPRGPTHAMFGQLMIPLQAGGQVKIGDSIEIIERKK